MSANRFLLLVAALVLGVVISTGALFASVRLVGPAVRAALGQPSGYGQDYATRQVLLEATLVRMSSVATAFLILGAVLVRFGVRRSWVTALAIANPVTVGIGYALYQRLWSGDFTGEYFGFVGLSLISVAAPILFAPCVFLGLSIARHH
jgi:hypothetical protein